jgi:hypothetical protein
MVKLLQNQILLSVLMFGLLSGMSHASGYNGNLTLNISHNGITDFTTNGSIINGSWFFIFNFTTVPGTEYNFSYAIDNIWRVFPSTKTLYHPFGAYAGTGSGGNGSTINNYYNVTGGNNITGYGIPGSVAWFRNESDLMSDSYLTYDNLTGTLVSQWFAGQLDWSYLQNVPAYLLASIFMAENTSIWAAINGISYQNGSSNFSTVGNTSYINLNFNGTHLNATMNETALNATIAANAGNISGAGTYGNVCKFTGTGTIGNAVGVTTSDGSLTTTNLNVTGNAYLYNSTNPYNASFYEYWNASCKITVTATGRMELC